MATPAHDRYHIVDPVCGMVDTETTRAEALALAKRHAERGCAHVTVYDWLARRGAPQEWTTEGAIVRRKEARP